MPRVRLRRSSSKTVVAIDEADHDLACVRRRQSKFAAKWHRLSGRQGLPLKRRGPRINLLVLGVSSEQMQMRHFLGFAGVVADLAIEDEDGRPVATLRWRIDSIEFKP